MLDVRDHEGGVQLPPSSSRSSKRKEPSRMCTSDRRGPALLVCGFLVAVTSCHEGSSRSARHTSSTGSTAPREADVDPDDAAGSSREVRPPNISDVDATRPENDPPPPDLLFRPVESLPALVEGDTREVPPGEHDGSHCRRGCADDGREVRYRLHIDSPVILRARLTAARGRDSDLHLHLYIRDGANEPRCVDGGFDWLERPIPAGIYDLVVDGPCGSEGAFSLEVDAGEPRPRRLPSMWNTFYILADEDSWSGPATTMLYDARCQPITKVRRAFYNSLCIQGSGVLSDDTVVNYARHCTTRCPRAERCRRFPVAICYQVLDPEVYPWGMGKAPRPLVPDWSLAVDPHFVPLDSVLYIQELDGVVPPGKTVPHDGCVAAVDTGGGIEDDHFDLFAGRRDRWLAWEKILPTKSRFRVWVDHPRCFRHRLDPDGDVTRPAP